MTEIALPHVIYGRGIAPDASRSAFDILAISDNLNPELIPTNSQQLPLHPVAGIPQDENGQAIAWISYTNQPQPQYLLARTHWRDAAHTLPITQLIYIPTVALRYAADDFQLLLQLVQNPLPEYEGTGRTVPALRLPVPVTSRLDQRIVMLDTFLRTYADNQIDLLLGVLGSVIHGQIVIRNYDRNWQKRFDLIAALMALLPTLARPYLTFSTYADTLDQTLPRVTFSEGLEETASVIDWANPQFAPDLLAHPYLALLRAGWDGSSRQLLETVRSLDTIAARILPGQSVWNDLTAVALRQQHDHAARIGEALPVDTLLAVLNSAIPPQGELRMHYLEQLLQRALEDRHVQAAEFAAHAMDNDPEVEQALEPILNHAIEFQPDAVYFFARSRLTEGLNRKWMVRLRKAAQQALDIALNSDDPDLITSWLTLLSREPLRYELVDVLRSGILAAREHVTGHSGLALELLVLAVKRQPDTLPVLLEDSNLRAALPDYVRHAMVDCDPDALEELSRHGREIFLLALSRTVEQGTNCISSGVIRALWEIHTQQQTNTLPPQYRPLAIIQNIAHDDHALQSDALVTLLTLILADHADALFADVSAILAGQDRLFAVLVDACIDSARPLDELLGVLNNLLAEDVLAAQQAIHTFCRLLENLEWGDDALPMVEQLARLLNQHPETEADQAILWRLLEISGELKSEQMMRVALRRLFQQIALLQGEAQIVENVLRMRKAITWSNNGRTVMIRWWRQYVRSQSVAGLQKLERALEGKRTLDELRSVVQTALALRRVMGQRSLEEFARDINITYSLLQSLAEGFDPDERDSAVDSATIRSELDARSDLIPPDSRHILATNLKQLAQIITTLAENRSKPSLMRSDDVLERQLVTGEQHPQSAVDVMRWLSGYFDGFQKDDLDK